MASRATLALVIVGALAPSVAYAQRGAAPAAPDPYHAADYIPTPPKEFEGLGLTEQLGATVPLTTPFRDQDGKAVVLGDYFKDDLPTILTFNYSDCPMLCSVQLAALAQSLGQIDYAPGKQFKVITIDLDSRETPHKISETKQKFVDLLPPQRRAEAARGWTFLIARGPADDASIKAVADAVGFHYKYLPENGQYAHPAALIFLSSRGLVTRYMGGTEYPPEILKASIIRAGMSEVSTSSGFVLNCFHYEAKDHGRVAVVAMRIGAVAFIVLFFSALGVWRLARRSRSSRPGVVRS